MNSAQEVTYQIFGFCVCVCVGGLLCLQNPVFYIPSTSQFELATFQVLNSYIQLIDTGLDRIVLKAPSPIFSQHLKNISVLALITDYIYYQSSLHGSVSYEHIQDEEFVLFIFASPFLDVDLTYIISQYIIIQWNMIAIIY